VQPVEAEVALGSRLLIAVDPVESEIHLGVGHAVGTRRRGDVLLDLVEVALENLEVAQPTVAGPGVGGLGAPRPLAQES
jgi:hypothetical protein